MGRESRGRTSRRGPMRRFRLIADFEFDALDAEGAARALGAHFASLGSDGESPISPDGRYLIECTDPTFVALMSPERRAELERARAAIFLRIEDHKER